MSRIDFDRYTDGDTLLVVTGDAGLDGFRDADPARADDLLAAADWCAAYEGQDTDVSRALVRAAGYLMREVARRAEAADVRAVQDARRRAGLPLVPEYRVREALRARSAGGSDPARG